jgi:hypothetical protein
MANHEKIITTDHEAVVRDGKPTGSREGPNEDDVAERVDD